MQKIFEEISKTIDKKGEISPFLFLSPKLELLHADIELFIGEIFKNNGIDAQSLFHFQNNGEALKIGDVKKFLAQGDVRPRFAFQVFLIEDISRMTLQAQNACLKFFEEPGEGNIIFLTNSSESGVLETILSRVQILSFSQSSNALGENLFYYSMIESHVSKTSDELVRYFFSGKYEKQEYIEFLTTIVSYILKTQKNIDILDELQEDIQGIVKNNLSARYITDKYIMILRK